MGVKFAGIKQWPIGETPDSGPWSSVWGYANAIGQGVEMDYDGVSEYLAKTTVQVEGVFTPSQVCPGVTASGAVVAAMALKYDALAAELNRAASGLPPDNPAYWGTSSDPRCVFLPSGVAGSGLYLRPLSLEIRESSWESVLAYSATLEEVRTPSCLVKIAGIPLMSPVISITAESPVLKSTRTAFSHGESHVFVGWNRRFMTVAGEASMIAPSGSVAAPGVSGLYNFAAQGTFDVYAGDVNIVSSGYFMESSEISCGRSSRDKVFVKLDYRQS